MNDQPISTEPASNEQKPRDPRAFNAFRHGLTGQVLIMTPADQAAYQNYCKTINHSWAPEGGMEASLAQCIADDLWRLCRGTTIDNSSFTIGLNEPDKY